MITNTYPSKRKPIRQKYWPAVIDSIEVRAQKLGITKEVYHERQKAVAKASAVCLLYSGQKVMPVKEADRAEHGVMTVVNVCRSYDLYGDIEWNDPPFILQLESGLKRGHFVNCTANWATALKKELNNEC